MRKLQLLAIAALVAAVFTAPALSKPPPGGGGGMDSDTLGELQCIADEIAKFDGIAWVCAPVNEGPQGEIGPTGATGPSAATLCTGQEVLLADGSCVDLLAIIDFLHPPPLTVFVTSATFSGDLATAGAGFDGVDGADNLCQAAADSPASIVPTGIYLAWISDDLSDKSPDVNFTKSETPYLLPDGTLVANDYADLTDGTISNPINIDETGGLVPGTTVVWTGTSALGGAVGANCGRWTSESDPSGGTFGLPNVTTTEWSLVAFTDSCAPPPTLFDHALYCFQQ